MPPEPRYHLGERRNPHLILRALLNAATILLVSSLAVYLVLSVTLPSPTELGEGDDGAIRIPRTIDDLKRLGLALRGYTETRYWSVVVAYCSVYIFLQSFAVPGSMGLSVLGGYLFGLVPALSLVSLCSAIGASMCYLLSGYAIKPIVEKYLSERMAKWHASILDERKHLLNYIIFLRVTPFLPNWFINLASPHLHVPLSPFFFGTLIGVAPPSFVHVQAGRALQDLTSLSGLATPANVFAIVVVAVLALLPVLIRRGWLHGWIGSGGVDEEVVVGVGDGGNEDQELLLRSAARRGGAAAEDGDARQVLRRFIGA